MHIGILYPPNHPHVQKWAKALIRAGARVTCFSFEEGELEGARVIPIPFSSKRNQTYRYHHYWLSAKRLSAALHQEKIDILHPMHLTPFGTWGWLSGFRPLVPYAMGSDVLTYFPMVPFSERHYWLPNVGSSLSIPKRLKSALTRPFYRWTVLQVLKQADMVVCDGEQMTFHLRKLTGLPESRIRFQPIGFDPSRFQADSSLWHRLCHEFGMPVNARCLLFHRGLLSVYRADVGLRAFEQILPHLPPSHICVILKGHYPVPSDIQPLLQQLLSAYPHKCCFIPRQLNEQEMAQLWLHTDIFLSIPVDDGFPMSLAEGLYGGAIPVLSAVPSYTELPLSEMGIPVLEKVNEIAIKDVVLTLFSRLPDHRKRIQQWKEWLRQRYDVNRNAQHFLSLCNSLMKMRSDQ
jgi:glycosyltransferase involved in cell wall biosynthesis